MKKKTIFSIIFLLTATIALADLKYQPISFELITDKGSYYESEKIK